MAQSTTQVPRAATYQEIFCAHCIAESSDKTPGDVSTMNGTGRKFYGRAAACAECGSVVRTLWWAFFHFPVIPLGSYRFKTASEDHAFKSRFWCRKLSGRNWPQILQTWGLAVAAVVAIAVGFTAWTMYHNK
jgi:hypothetical protein